MSQSLPEYQKLIRQLVIERGYDSETVAEVFMLFLEEAGEFAKAARQNATSIKNGDHSQKYNLSQEAADVFWLLIDLCNRMDIDLEQAFLEKEKINRSRTYS